MVTGAQKIEALRKKSQASKNQPRDRQGRWVSSSTSSSNTNLKFLAIARASAQKQKNRLEYAKEYKESYQYFKQEFEIDNYRQQIVLKGTGGKTYNKLKAELGTEAADLALEKHLHKASTKATKQIILNSRIKKERNAIAKKGSEQKKLERDALDRIRPELKYKTTLADFKKQNPGEIDKVVAQYREELRLDKALTHDAIMHRGKTIAAQLEKDLKLSTSDSEILAAHEKFRNELIGSGLSRQEAIQLTDSKVFDKSLDEGIWGIRQTAATGATEFYQLTGGKGSKYLDSFKITKERAYASQPNRYINVGSYPSKETIFHEMGHHVEFDDVRIRDAAEDWRGRRAFSHTPQKLSQIVQNSNYIDDEIALPGKFVHPYVGKVYSGRLTEVVSMGLERFSSAETMRRFYEEDPGHFYFILGVIRDHD